MSIITDENINYTVLTHILQTLAFYAGVCTTALFPAEYPKGNEVDDYHPCADHTQLRKNVNKMLALCRNKTNTVNNWR